MINAALRADPENAELQQLKTDLETLIQLTKQSMGVVNNVDNKKVKILTILWKFDDFDYLLKLGLSLY